MIQSWSALTVPSPVVIVLLPVNRFLNKLAPKVPNNILRNPPFCSFASFYLFHWHLSLTILLPFISSFKIIVLKPDPHIFLRIAAFFANDAAVNPNGIKTILTNGLSTFPIKGNPVLSNAPKSLPRNPPDYPILCNWVFDSFILAEELFAKALWSFKTCVLIYKNLWRKLFSSLESPTTFEEFFKDTSVPFFIPCFNLF